jgi:hypothetical protein
MSKQQQKQQREKKVVVLLVIKAKASWDFQYFNAIETFHGKEKKEKNPFFRFLTQPTFPHVVSPNRLKIHTEKACYRGKKKRKKLTLWV